MTCEFVTPLRSRSSTSPACPESTVVAARLPALPCGSALKPCALIVRALDLVSPVLLQNSARLRRCGSKSSPASAAISASAASIISYRSSCLSFTSMFLLTPACWHHQRSGGGHGGHYSATEIGRNRSAICG